MKKYIKRISIFIFLAIISLTTIFYVKADSGWDSDYSGGSDWGGSDWGGTDHDSNYGEFTGSTGDIIFLVLVLSGMTASIIAAAVYINKKNKQYLTDNEVSDEIYNQYMNIPKKQLRKKLYNLYINIEKNKVYFCYDSLKSLCTSQLYQEMVNDMKKLEKSNHSHIRMNFRKQSVVIKNIEKDNNELSINIDINLFLKDYIIDRSTNKIVKGNKKLLTCEFHSLKFVLIDNNYLLDKDETQNKRYINFNGITYNSNNTDNKTYQDLDEEKYLEYFNIDKVELKDKINKHFIDVQKSWMNFNYDNLRKLCTDELYNQYKIQLETLKLKNEQNIMSDFNINEVSIYNIKKVNNITEISVYLDIKFRDYVINTNTNKVVRGSEKIYFNNSYELTFVMSNKDKLINCPSCGAPIEVISSNVCPYCKNTIVQTSNELVLSKKKIVSSRKTNK